MDQLQYRKAELAKQAPDSQHKKAWLDKIITICYMAYKEQQPVEEP